MAETDEEKEFEPTPQRLAEARKKGEIAKSADLNTAAAYLGFLSGLAFVFDDIIYQLGEVLVAIIELSRIADQIALGSSALALTGDAIGETMRIIVPIFLMPAGCVIASIIAQRSFTVAPEKIHVKIDRISPISGFKNKYGRAGLFDFLKSAAKLLLFIGILAVFLLANFETIAMAAQLAPRAALVNMGNLLTSFLAIVFALTLLVGLIDFSFQQAEHRRKNRMSRKDLMDEIKNSEGDPLVKQRRRQKALALAAGQMANVPNASVVMANPTHYAVALQWSPGVDSAPIVVAKGTDEVARKIRAIASDAGVPIHSDPPATRALFGVADVGDPVPPELYEAVAVAIRFAEDLRQKQSQTYG